MTPPMPTLTDADRAMMRRAIEGLQAADRAERERTRGEVVDSSHCRDVADHLWLQLREIHGIQEGDAKRDDEAESKVARAIAAVGAAGKARAVA